MSRLSFNAVLELLAPALAVDEQQSTNRTGIDPITPTNKLQMFLRFMSGGSCHDIIAYSGVADTTYYDSVEELMRWIKFAPSTQDTTASPGGTGDFVAYQEWGFSKVVKEFEFGRYIVGDNAYANANNLLTPFAAPSLNDDQYRDSFNYHLSQLRIRIEMAFGLLVRKWRIFCSPLQVKFDNVARVVMSGCILHNWCINQRLAEDDNYRIENDEILIEATSDLPEMNTARSSRHDSRHRRLYMSPIGDTNNGPNTRQYDVNLLRNAYVRKLKGLMQVRPHRNITRRAREEARRK